MTWWQYTILIVFTYIVMTMVFMWGTSEENWNAGVPDHTYDVKYKF
jgi:hypothetical protein